MSSFFVATKRKKKKWQKTYSFQRSISKTFRVDVSKTVFEKHFGINAEREEYYKDVASEIEVESTESGKKKSVLADLNAKKEEAAKQLRKKNVIVKNRSR